eukprot:9498617-Pyramimonas_sp.AAC.1
MKRPLAPNQSGQKRTGPLLVKPPATKQFVPPWSREVVTGNKGTGCVNPSNGWGEGVEPKIATSCFSNVAKKRSFAAPRMLAGASGASTVRVGQTGCAPSVARPSTGC